MEQAGKRRGCACCDVRDGRAATNGRREATANDGGATREPKHKSKSSHGKAGAAATTSGAIT